MSGDGPDERPAYWSKTRVAWTSAAAILALSYGLAGYWQVTLAVAIVWLGLALFLPRGDRPIFWGEKPPLDSPQSRRSQFLKMGVAVAVVVLVVVTEILYG